MSGLILPESVVRQVRAERMLDIEMAHRTDVCRDFTRELQLIDPYLELVWWPQTASAPGFIPGRYHIVRHNPDAPGSVEPFVDDLGGYREPDSSLFDLVRRSDMWNVQAMRDRKRVQQAALDAKSRREQREHEERQEELRDRIAAATQTRVSFNQDTPWTQNASPAARRDAAQRREPKDAA